MKTIRLREMTDEEYKLVTKSVCPVCGSGEHARTSFGNITSTGRCVDVVCDECGAAWSLYAVGDGSLQEQIRIPEVLDKAPSPRDVAMDDLLHLSDNKLRRMKKSELIALAIDLDEDDIARLNKPEMVEALICIRNEAH